MLKKSLIAAAAIAAAVTVAAPAEQASAKTHVDVNVGFGFGGWGPGYGYWDPGYGYGAYPAYRPYRPYRPYWGVSCFAGQQIVRNHGFRGVYAVDCSRPAYKYNAWRFGVPYRVVVDARGMIINARPL
jgi:hypothetical protein